MSFKQAIHVCHDGSVVAAEAFRDLSNRQLLAICALVTIATDESTTPDETGLLSTWLFEELEGRENVAELVLGLRMADSPKPPQVSDVSPGPSRLSHAHDGDWLLLLNFWAEQSVVVDVSSRFVYGGNRALAQNDLARRRALTVNDLSRLCSDDYSYDTMPYVNLYESKVPFDLLRTEDSPTYDHLARPREHFRTVAQPETVESGAPASLLAEPFPANASIRDFDLAPRTMSVLSRAGITTLGQVDSLTPHELVSMRNLNRWCVRELDDLLECYGRSLVD